MFNLQFELKEGIHEFPQTTFGLTSDLIQCASTQQQRILLIASSEQGAAPDNISFATGSSFVVLQHLAASVPSKKDCERYDGLSMKEVELLFDKYDFRHVVVCGHLECGVIRSWLKPKMEGQADMGKFRLRFEQQTKAIVETNYQRVALTKKSGLMVCEHVLCQIENLLTHCFVLDRVRDRRTTFHGWVVDDNSARIYDYNCRRSMFVRI